MDVNRAMLAELWAAYPAEAAAVVQSFELEGRRFDGNARADVMGVVNLSPESRHRESVCLTTDEAIARGERLFAQGASVMDVGAESSLDDAARVSPSQQVDALVPVVRGLAGSGIVSVETYHPDVARACLAAGARVLNLTGREDASLMYRLVAEYQAAVVICYSVGKNVREVGALDTSGDPIPWLDEYFGRQIDLATACGVERLWLDPGLSFQYRDLTPEQRRRYQTGVFLNTFRLRARGWPVCQALPFGFRTSSGELVTHAESYYTLLARLGGSDLLRAHDVAVVAEAIGRGTAS